LFLAQHRVSDKRIGESSEPSSPLLNESAVSSEVISIDYPLSAEFVVQIGQTPYLLLSLAAEEAIVEMGISFVGSPGAIQNRYIS
jgi:hypothetical protein